MQIQRRPICAGCELPDDLHPVLRQVLSRRPLASLDELSYGLDALIPPDSLGGTGEAAELLFRHFERRILVVGDFDADGATSTALALLGLRAMGARYVDYLVPDRFRFGYGLTPEIVQLAQERRAELIVTVDNGISSIAGVAAARAHGMQVLVTDHHLPGAELPAAEVIVNPNLPGDPFPSKALAGVGVMFYVLLALRRLLRQRSHPGGSVNLAEWLDLVALGTVADVAALDHNNRVLVHQGLARIRAGRCRPGIQALINVSGRVRAGLVASDLGFALGPRLNAAGRLEDMSIGIECLLAEEPGRAALLAQRLDALNRERRDIEQQMQLEALDVIERLQLADELPPALCLHQDDWHQGVVGIVASRIKERVHRPVIAFARDGQSGLLKGSGRSINGVHLRDVLDAVAVRHPGLIEKFGGHAMAAGLSLRAERLAAFEAALHEEMLRWVDPAELRGVIHSDGELPAQFLTLECAEILREAGPWGQHFPEPVFDGIFEVRDARVVGERHLRLRLGCEGSLIDGIAFNAADTSLGSRVHAAYRLDVNEWNGTRRPQLVLEHLLPCD